MRGQRDTGGGWEATVEGVYVAVRFSEQSAIYIMVKTGTVYIIFNFFSLFHARFPILCIWCNEDFIVRLFQFGFEFIFVNCVRLKKKVKSALG